MNMEFRDLKRQYQILKNEIDNAVYQVIYEGNYIHGRQVAELEKKLAKYVGAKYCISCANGTDALQIALMAWGIGKDDVVLVPDFTFFSSGEVVSAVGAEPCFVDVNPVTYNIDSDALINAIAKLLNEAKRPKAIIAVDLFGQPAEHGRIREIADEYGLFVLEDGAQGFGGAIGDKMACSFGDISTTSFFPAKPLGCYGDGGAIFTDNGEWAELMRSYCVHGKGESTYDNVRIGMNSRLDTIQAVVLLAKLPHFIGWEMKQMQTVAGWYSEQLKDIVMIPKIKDGFTSSWAQFTIQVANIEARDRIVARLMEEGIPSAIYYQKPMHRQMAFSGTSFDERDYLISLRLSETVLSLPFHPYLNEEEVTKVSEIIRKAL